MKHGEIDCIAFLQWALPRMRMRWAGFRKVRSQVCKRIQRRIAQLGLFGFSAYQAYLEKHDDEWDELDALCIVTISRFYRDKRVFDILQNDILPDLAERARKESRPVRCWSAGCASGEEPYTLSMIWRNRIVDMYPGVTCGITATDIASHMLQRARRGCYDESSLRDLPAGWKDKAFTEDTGVYCIADRYKEQLEFCQQDIRAEMPEGPFDLVLCRNLVGYYYEEALQTEVYGKIYALLSAAGVLVLGRQEHMPAAARALFKLDKTKCFYRKQASVS